MVVTMDWVEVEKLVSLTNAAGKIPDGSKNALKKQLAEKKTPRNVLIAFTVNLKALCFSLLHLYVSTQVHFEPVDCRVDCVFCRCWTR